MILLKRKSCLVLASTIFESPLHHTKGTYSISFCTICQVPPPDRPFGTRILYRKVLCQKDATWSAKDTFCHMENFPNIPYGKKQLLNCGGEEHISARPGAGGKSCKQDSFLLYRKVLRQRNIDW